MSNKTNRRRQRKSKKRQRVRRTRRQVQQPSAMSVVIQNQNPLKQLRLRHVEFIKDLVGDGTAYMTQNFVINPGCSDTFAWLSKIATAFESYVFNSLTFFYVPSCATSDGGSVGLAPDYDPEDALNTTTTVAKQILSSFQDAVRSPIWQSVAMKCTPSNLHKRKTYFVRESDFAEAGNRAMDTGRLHYWLSGVAADVGGEIWVSYDITLFTPQRTNLDTPDETFGVLSKSGGVEKTYPFKNDLNELMPLKTNDDHVALDSVGDTLLFSEPGKLYNISTILTDNGGFLSGIADWGTAVNGTLSYLKSSLDPTSQEATYLATFETDHDVSEKNLASITHPGVLSSNTHIDETLLSIIEVDPEMMWASF